MGGGASSEQAEDLTRKLDKLNEQLEQLNQQQQAGARRRSVSRGILADAPTPSGGRKQRAGFDTHVGFGADTSGGTTTTTVTATNGASSVVTSNGKTTLVPQPPGKTRHSISARDVDFEEPDRGSPRGSPKSKPLNAPSPEKAMGTGSNPKKFVAEAKQRRADFFLPLYAMKKPSGSPLEVDVNDLTGSFKPFRGGDHHQPMEWQEIPKMPGVKCVWLHCAALALSYVSGGAVTMESILRTNQLALHLVSFPSVTLAELYDIVAEFCETEPSMKKLGIRAEVATLESEILDDSEDPQGTGDRQPVLNLANFRKEMAEEQGNPNSLYIFNYNPFFVQEAEALQRRRDEEEEDDEDDEEAEGDEEAMQALTLKRASRPPEPPHQWASLKNMGTFSILVSYNPALHNVTLGTPHLGPDNQVGIELHTCSLQTLYQATKHPDGYTKRPRGFVRVFKAESLRHEPIKPLFPTSTIDGRNSRGLLSVSLDIAIAPHVLGLGILHHLATAAGVVKVVQEPQSLPARRKSLAALGAMSSPPRHAASPNPGPTPQMMARKGTVVLNGILADLVDVLRLPVHMLVGQSSGTAPQSAGSMLAQAVSWYSQFLLRKKFTGVAVGHVPITRRDGAEDGAVSVPEDDFFAAVTNAVNTHSLMLVGFNVNKAQNCSITSSDAEATHFAVVVGVDDHRGIVKLADVSVKKYRKVWHLPLMRLYSAVIGCGYMMVSSSEVVANTSGGVEKADLLSGIARYRLPPCRAVYCACAGTTVLPPVLGGNGSPTAAPASAFEYPRKNYSVTVLASVLSQLGFPTSVEDLVYGAGFHISFLLSEHIPMLDQARILSYYSHIKLGDEVAVLATTLDSAESLPVPVFAAMLRGATSRDRTRGSGVSSPMLPTGDSPSPERATNGASNPLPIAETRSIIIVAYDTATIQKDLGVWNGSQGGSSAQVVGFDASKGTVMLIDSNPDTYYRQWECPVALLHEACCKKDRITDRARGFLRVTRQRSDQYVVSKSIDLRRAMVHHPFKVPISSAGSAIALAFSELTGDAVSCEEVLYSSSGFSLCRLTATMTAAEVISMIEGYCKTHTKKYTTAALVVQEEQEVGGGSLSPSSGAKIKMAQLEEGAESGSMMDLVLYDVAMLWGEEVARGSGQTQGAGIISHADGGAPGAFSGGTSIDMPQSLVVVDGNPSRFGASWRVGVEKLQSCVTAIVRIQLQE